MKTRIISRRKHLALHVACSILISTSSCALLAGSEKFNIDIKEQIAGTALVSLGEYADVQITIPNSIANSVVLKPLKGEYTLGEALDTMLNGSGLSYEFLSSDSVLIKPAAINGEVEKRSGKSVNSKSDIEEVVITGSRIVRSEFTSPTPLTVIDSETIQQSGFNTINDVLLRTPSLGVGLGAANSQYNGEAGAGFVNLRGMGIDRTLIVVNGRRRVSGSSTTSAVDVNTIPAGMIERVEIITGGASAVYGADAVTGVVNIITKDDYEGIEFSGRRGISQHGGGDNVSFNLNGGAKFSENRGSITFGASYAKEQALSARQRDFSSRWDILFTNPNNTGPNDGIPDQIHLKDARLPLTHYAGTFTVGDNLYTVDPNLRLVQNGDRPFSFLGTGGGDGFNVVDQIQLRGEQEIFALRTNLNYQLTDDVNFFVETEFSLTDSLDADRFMFDNAASLAGLGPILYRDNPFLPDDVGALMDANNLDQIFVQRTYKDHGSIASVHDRKTYTGVFGFEGQFSNDWNWQLFYQYGQYTDNIETENARIDSRFLNAIDVISDPVSGDPVCRDEAARSSGCVPLNILGRNVASQAALDYIYHTRLQEIKNTQQVFGAQLTGDLFDLPAGPLSFAAGAEHRKETLSTLDDGLAIAGELYWLLNGNPARNQEFDVSEAFAEFLAPVVRDKTLIHELNVEGAIRYSDYSSIGSTVSWKLGTEWAVTEGLRFRASRSRSVRAPNLNELYNPDSINTLTVGVDPCSAEFINAKPNRAANCAALGVPDGFVNDSFQVAGEGVLIMGGNPDLKEETSNSYTIGAVFTPSAIDGLSISLDYWSIKIEDAINALTLQTIVDGCVDGATIDNPLCPLITRGSDFIIDSIEVRDINIGELRADGIDFVTAYSFNVLNDATLRMTLTGTYLLKNEELIQSNDPSSLLIQDGEIDNPDLRMTLRADYYQGPWSASLVSRYISSASADVQLPAEARDINKVGSKIYNDLVIGHNLDDRYQINLGINNLFDVKPPYMSETYTGTGRGSLYDNIGRFVFLSGTMRF